MAEAAPRHEFYRHLDDSVKDYGAEKEVVNLSERTPVTEHDHFFKEIGGAQIQCVCGMGFYVDAQDQLKDGHLERDGQRVI